MLCSQAVTCSWTPYLRILACGKPGLGAGLVLASLAFFFPAVSLGAPNTLGVRVSGSLLPADVVHKAVGPDPAADLNFAEWASGACKRIVAAHQAEGYHYARAWYSLEETTLVWIYVDPGRVRVEFLGVGSLGAAIFRLNLNLPGSVFRESTVIQALEQLRKKYGLVSISYLVTDIGEIQLPLFGAIVPERVMRVYVVSREFLGWSFDVSVSATWGVVPSLSFEHGGLLLDDDRLSTRFELALPYRQYVFEQEAHLQWVHGGFEAAYRLPRRMRGWLAPRLATSLFLSRYDRLDLDIKTFDVLRSTTVPMLLLFRSPLEVSLGVGADVVRIVQLERVTGSPEALQPLGDMTYVRALVRLVANLDPQVLVTRRDQRPWMRLEIDAASSDLQKGFLSTRLSGQWATSVGRHHFAIRGRGVVLAGDVRFWDDIPLAGEYQRVFFNNQYWIHHAVQLETAYRVGFWRDWIAVGVFHDASLFMDRRLPVHGIATADAFGPSVHLLLLDTFALNVYAGFGFAPVGFDQTITFTLQTIF
jgi:hypothetical protein